MSTIATTNLKNPSSASNNIVLGTGGDTTVTNNLTVSGTGNHSIAGTLQFNSGYGSAATAYGCRAWVNFDGTTATPSTRRGSGNVSSVTKTGSGAYTVNFSSAMPDANYATVVSGGQSVSASGAAANATQACSTSTTSVNIGSLNANTGAGSTQLQDFQFMYVAIFR